MTKEEYEKKIAELQVQIDELKNTQIEEKPTPPHPRWLPEYKEKYYVLSTSGHPIETYWAGCSDDLNEYAIGNVFMNRLTVNFVTERLKVLAEMREWAGNSYDGAYIYYHRPSDQILTNWDSTHYHGGIRFKCIDDAENCIKTVGEDRIKKYYFMIPEV